MRMPRPVLAVCALLALTGCGPSAATVSPGSGGDGRATTATGSSHHMRGGVMEFGADHRFPSGLVVNVAEPKSFQPSDSAYPRARRAAAFNIAIYNESAAAYRMSGLSVRMTVAGEQAPQVVDATQGYSGIADADRDLASGDVARMTLAFVAPPPERAVRLTVRPDTGGEARVVYTGTT